MPPVGKPVASNGISIHVDNPTVYRPGDIIHGSVTVYNARQVKPGTSVFVNLDLCGRSKTKMKHKNTVKRGRAIFLNHRLKIDCSNSTVPHVQGLNSKIYPFQMLIPTEGKYLSALRDGHWEQDGNFMSSRSTEAIKGHSLPSVVYLIGSNMWTGVSHQAYVEYWLEARLGGIETSYTESPDARYPIFLHKKMPEKPLENLSWKPMYRTYEHSVKKIKPKKEKQVQAGDSEATDEKLRLERPLWKTSTFRGTGTYRYQVHCTLPAQMQLDHPDPVYVKAWVHPVLPSCTIHDGDLSNLPPVMIESAVISLKQATRVRTQSTFGHWDTYKETSYRLSTIESLTGVLPVLPTEAHNIALSPEYLKAGTEYPASNQAEHLAAIKTIRIPSPKSVPLHGLDIQPSFGTYNFSISHAVHIILHLRCAGASEVFKLRVPMQVFPPSEGQALVAVKNTFNKKDDMEQLIKGMEMVSLGMELTNNILSAIAGC
jgi:hypothetical protein